MIGFAQIVVAIFGALMLIGGLWLATFGNEGEFWLVVIGLFTALAGLAGMGVLVIERMRYHSEAAEGESRTPDHPGGEPIDAPLEPRFRPTAEVFVDPTSGRTLRVHIDPATGERRYRVEG